MQSFFFNMVGVSITISIVVIVLLLLSSYLNERYAVKWRYFIWLILAVRLMIPFDFGLTSPPLELNLSDREIIYGIDQEQLPDLALPELGELDETENASFEQKAAYENNTEAYNTEMLAARKFAEKSISISQIAAGIYLTGILAFLLWQLGLYISFRHATRRWYREVSNQKILEIFENLKVEMGILKAFKVRICKKTLSPMITGLFKPTLLLPHEGYQKIDLEIILKHELVHVKRNDLWFKLLLIFTNALHWFNPVIYLMVKEANKDIEISCDEEVLKGADLSLRKRYSERILELMQGNNFQEAPISTNFYGGKGMMKSRILHIFDERVKKKGTLSFLLIMALILIFSACQFDIGQNQWEIPIMKNSADAYDQDAMGNRNKEMSDFAIHLPFDQNQDGKNDSSFSLLVSDEGKTCKLKYEIDRKKSVEKQVFEGVEPGAAYGIQAANMEDLNSIMLLISIDYHGMPFGSGYWELYSWKDGSFEQVDLKTVEKNLQMKILEPSEIKNNSMKAEATAYLYDQSQYPSDYPAAGLYFKDNMVKGEDGTLSEIYYAPMSDYDVEGYHTWGQESINKTMIGMNLVQGDNVEAWEDPSRALLETEEIVFMTLPNITATVKHYYQYQNGKWSSVDGMIE